MGSSPFYADRCSRKLTNCNVASTKKEEEETMKKHRRCNKSVAALAMAAVVAVSLLGYGCGSKSASTTGAACYRRFHRHCQGLWAAMLPLP